MPTNVMHYKDYFAELSYDASADSFHGRVLNLSDVIDFYGRTPQELREEFKNSIEEYLEWCAEDGREPEKTWRGKLTLRPDTDLRKRITVAASASGESLNTWALKTLDREARKVLESID